MAAGTTPLTIDDFEKLPDELVHYKEHVDGELADASGNVGDHNSLRHGLAGILRPFVRQHQLGRVIAEQEFPFG